MKTFNSPNVAVVGATGAVGQTMLSILEAREFPLSGLRLMASARGCDPDGIISDALMGSAHGTLYQMITDNRPATAGGAP